MEGGGGESHVRSGLNLAWLKNPHLQSDIQLMIDSEKMADLHNMIYTRLVVK